jgi:hypothetical protein
MSNSSDNKNDLFDKQQIDDVLRYCYKNIQYMWASSIASILLNCDFRDAKNEIEDYFREDI